MIMSALELQSPIARTRDRARSTNGWYRSMFLSISINCSAGSETEVDTTGSKPKNLTNSSGARPKMRHPLARLSKYRCVIVETDPDRAGCVIDDGKHTEIRESAKPRTMAWGSWKTRAPGVSSKRCRAPAEIRTGSTASCHSSYFRPSSRTSVVRLTSRSPAAYRFS